MRSIYIIIFFIALIIILVLASQKIDESNTGSVRPANTTDIGMQGNITSTYTIAFISDARPIKETSKSKKTLRDDLGQIIPQSPTKRVDAVIMIGDMDTIDRTSRAYEGSTAKDIPLFYVVGNHELNNKNDLLDIRKAFASYRFDPSPGPDGTRETTYSFDIGDMHVVVLNEYWDGNNDGVCDWKVPDGGINADDSCFKYDKGEGGFITDAQMKWLENDLDRNNKNWTIVVGHEPLYPTGRHVGNSLDKDKENRDKIAELLTAKKVSVFAAAHTHFSNVANIDGIFHINGGVSGIQTIQGSGDPFTSIIYAFPESSDQLKLTHVKIYPKRRASESYVVKK